MTESSAGGSPRSTGRRAAARRSRLRSRTSSAAPPSSRERRGGPLVCERAQGRPCLVVHPARPGARPGGGVLAASEPAPCARPFPSETERDQPARHRPAHDRNRRAPCALRSRRLLCPGAPSTAPRCSLAGAAPQPEGCSEGVLPSRRSPILPASPPQGSTTAPPSRRSSR